jgi:hypothetical protein
MENEGVAEAFCIWGIERSYSCLTNTKMKVKEAGGDARPQKQATEEGYNLGRRSKLRSYCISE